jgi:catechol 2,3-dioxygenase-like lactoylglutathione lyase family enzyme
MTTTPTPARHFNHVAFPTADTASTCRFYTEVLGMRLAGAVRPDRSGTTEKTTPTIHTFFATESGECIAFFEIPGFRPEPNRDGAPVFTRHVAFGVDSEEKMLAWRRRLKAAGVDVSRVVDHDGLWKSIYFPDPNGLLLEITFQTRPLGEVDAEEAERLVAEWTLSRHDLASA